MAARVHFYAHNLIKNRVSKSRDKRNKRAEREREKERKREREEGVIPDVKGLGYSTGFFGLQVAGATVGSQDFPLWFELGLQLGLWFDPGFFRYLW